MKKLILRITGILAAVAAVILLLNSLAVAIQDRHQPSEMTIAVEKYRSMPDSIAIACFGSSHGRDCYDRETMGWDSSFNFCLSYQTPQYDWALMKEYAPRLRDDALVFITVSYMSPYWSIKPEVFESKQVIYSRLLSWENMADCSPGDYLRWRYTPLILRSSAPQILGQTLQALLAGPAPEPPAPGAWLEEFRQLEHPEELQMAHQDEIAVTFPQVNTVMYGALQDMLRFSLAQGWTPVLVTPPYSSQYQLYFTEDFRQTFRLQVEELAREFDVPYWDYSLDSRFADSPGMFQNIDHMSPQGAQAFTRLLLDRAREELH